MSNVVNHKNEWRDRAVFGFVGLTMVCVVASAGAQTRSVAGDGGDGFFENVIRPLLVDRCFQCHSGRSDTPAGGLRLDSRETVLKGGDTGPAVVPGDSRASLLVQRVQGRPVLMPPTGALVASEIENLITWIDMGAPWPENAVVAATPDPSDAADRPLYGP